MVQVPKKLTSQARFVTPKDVQVKDLPSEYQLFLIKCPSNVQITCLDQHRFNLDPETMPPYQTLNDSLKFSFVETSELKNMKVLVPSKDNKHFVVKKPDYLAALVEAFHTTVEKEEHTTLNAKRKLAKEIETDLDLPSKKKKKKRH